MPLLLTTQMDIWKILTETQERVELFGLLVGLLFLLAVVLVIGFYRGQRARVLSDGLDVARHQTASEMTALLKSILESPQSVVIFALDPSYRYLQFTNAHKETIKKIWGVDIQTGMNMLDVIGDPDQRSKAKSNFDRTLAGEWLMLIEEYGDEKNRTFYEDRYSPIMDHEGKVTGLTVFVLDISDRMRIEEELRHSLQNAEQLAFKAEQGSRARIEFLSVMNHELRTPLNGILGVVEILKLTKLDNDQQELVQIIHDNGEHLLGMVNNILDFSCIDKDIEGIGLDSEQVLLRDFLATCCEVILECALKKGLQFQCETSPDAPIHITGDARRIRQILTLLLHNAVKFTAHGSVVMRVSAAREGDRQFVDFAVKDTGPGIPPEILERLFKPFVQADSSYRRPFEGAGLGLALSKRLAEAMQGTITVDSAPGLGSTFTLRLPLA
ncbi:MAG: ATP-binding protein [Verrucomicrobiota bacterium]